MTSLVESPSITITRIQQLSPEHKALWDAADYIEKHGKSVGDYGEDGGPRCVIGAIWSVNGNDSRRPRQSLQLRLGIPGDGGLGIEEWSDSTDTETVIKTLREVALSE